MSEKKSEKKDPSSPGEWKDHDTYHSGVSSNRIVTRSQTAFLRIKHTTSDLDLFSDPSRHQPPDQPHFMQVMQGPYGSVPRTIITRSTGKFIPVDNELIKKLKVYKKYKPEK